MGCGSRAGKMEMHSAGKPQVEQEYCVGCGKCQRICAHDAPVITPTHVSPDGSDEDAEPHRGEGRVEEETA